MQSDLFHCDICGMTRYDITENGIRSRMYKGRLVTHVCSNMFIATSGGYLIFIEGASHSVPQRTECPPNLGPFFHLLCTILLILIPAQRHQSNRTESLSHSQLITICTS